MRNLTAFVIVVYLALVVGGVLGYCWNIARFLDADCDREFMTCVVRGVGMVVVPVGAVMGYIPNE